VAYNIENYDPSATDSVSGNSDGFGRPNVPPNYNAGTDQGPGVGYGQPLDWSTDILSDPVDNRDNDPGTGYKLPYPSARV
jgi:hypothetical protein